ncbi:hypothetical protein [Sciscionella marina]|uniref:hypothetical protein n=1 Tax=Sciscionella marina TaxID=508770 RepID=UPI0003627A8B|nr:hypothetical protein [Sciscionella marina]
MTSDDARPVADSSACGLEQRLILLAQYLDRRECKEAAEAVTSVAVDLRQAWDHAAGEGVRDLYDMLETVQAGIGSVLDILESQFGHEIERGHRS